MSDEQLPPLGVRLTVDVEEVQCQKGVVYKARVRWTHPKTHHWEGTKRVFDSRGEADEWLNACGRPRTPGSIQARRSRRTPSTSVTAGRAAST